MPHGTLLKIVHLTMNGLSYGDVITSFYYVFSKNMWDVNVMVTPIYQGISGYLLIIA